MGKEDVRKALLAMDDGEVRERLANGDFSDVSGSALDEHERTLVRDAAADYPDVTGFAGFNFMKLPGINEALGADAWKWRKFVDAVDYAWPTEGA